MRRIALLFLLTLGACASHKTSEQRVCEKIIIHSEEEIKLSEDETRLICGDSKTEAYNLIPDYQASFLATGFLQARGYTNPRFETQKGILHIYPQEKVYISKVIIEGDTSESREEFQKKIYRRFKQEVLRPKVLNNIEDEAKLLYRNESYPCVKVTSTADPKTGEVVLKISGLKKFHFGEFDREEVEGIYKSAFDRFTSFSAVDNFSERELTLTEKRILRSEVAQGVYFQEKCDLDKGEYSFYQKFILGEPRTVRFGIGASTEYGPMFRFKWAHLRYGNMASRREINVQATFVNQSVHLLSEHFFWKDAPRRSVVTEALIDREDQTNYQEYFANVGSRLQWTRDNWSRFFQWSAGPAYTYSRFNTNEDPEYRTSNTFAVEAEFLSKTHNYEVYDIHPGEGEMYQVNLDGRPESFGFEEDLLKIDTTIVHLWDITSWGRGEAIIGGRLTAGTSWVRESVNLNLLPPSVKFYGGGSDDIRGFELESLPDNNGVGALTKVAAKFEFRKTYTFLPTIESLVFIDGGLFGQESWTLDDRLFYSPGLGLRWLSPIGLVQTYLARALSNKTVKDDGWFYYIGFGGVF